MSVYKLTGTALLLAIALLCQMIRLLLPVTPQVSMFFFGAIVNACMILATWKYGYKSGMVIALVTPVIAFMQGMLPFIFFVPFVALGNVTYVLIAKILQNKTLVMCTAVGSIIKMATLFLGFTFLFKVLLNVFSAQIPIVVQNTIMLMMSWPQLVTSALGILFATIVYRRLNT